MTTRRLEVCVADAASLAAAIAGGADRIELCTALELGGLTPSPGLMRRAAAAPIPVHALIRPRSGDFVFGAADMEAMLADIDAVRAAGLAGVVLGASRSDGTLDRDLLARLRDRAAGLAATLHRAIDLAPDPIAATDTAVALGFARVLTSGGAACALDGLAVIAAMHRQAAGRLSVMAGSGITPAAIVPLLQAVPLDEVHGSFAVDIAVSEPAVRLGFSGSHRRVTDRATVAAAKAALLSA